MNTSARSAKDQDITPTSIQTALQNIPVVKCDCCQGYVAASYVSEVKWTPDEEAQKAGAEPSKWLMCSNCERSGEYGSMVYRQRRLKMEREEK